MAKMYSKEDDSLKAESHKFVDRAGVIAHLLEEGMSENEAKEIGNILNDYFTSSFLAELDKDAPLSESGKPYYEKLKNSLHSILSDQKVEKIGIDFLNRDFPDRRTLSLRDLNRLLWKLYNTMIPFFYYKSHTHLGRFIFLRKSHHDIFVTFLKKFTENAKSLSADVLKYE